MKRGRVLGVMILALQLAALSGCLLRRPAQPSLGQSLAREGRLVSLLGEATEYLRSPAATALSDAEAALQLALELAPEDPRVIDGLGCVAWRRGESARAKELFQRVLILNPLYDRAYVHLALIAQDEGDDPAAAALLQRALELNPLNVRARNNYALLLGGRGMENSELLGAARREIRKANRSVRRVDRVLLRNLSVLEGAFEATEETGAWEE